MSESATLAGLVVKARAGDAEAFGVVVRRFQDMAVGYGYALLGDLQLAEDAAQEAFLEAYLCLPQLREPAAFPGWFRRIVFKQCDRLRRGKAARLEPLAAAREQPSAAPTQAEAMEQQEMHNQVWAAIDALPEHERRNRPGVTQSRREPQRRRAASVAGDTVARRAVRTATRHGALAHSARR